MLFVSMFSNILIKGDNRNISLPGKIGITLYDSFYIISNNSVNYKFEAKSDKFIHDGFRWLQNKDALIGINYSLEDNGNIISADIVSFNLKGKMTNTIYKAGTGEIASNAYLSQNDKYLLFTTVKKGNINLDPLEGLHRKKALNIIEFNSKKVVCNIKNFGDSLDLELEENPWLLNQNDFVYSLTKGQFLLDNNSKDMPNDVKTGIYIFNLHTKKKKLIIPNGHFAVCSPIENRIAFIKEQGVWIKDLKNNKLKRIFEVTSNDKIINIHWTPDGKFIYVAYYTQYNHDNVQGLEKLIDLRTNMEVPFNKIGLGFNRYTWK